MSVGWLVGLSGVQPEQTSMTFGVDPDKVTDPGFFLPYLGGWCL